MLKLLAKELVCCLFFVYACLDTCCSHFLTIGLSIGCILFFTSCTSHYQSNLCSNIHRDADFFSYLHIFDKIFPQKSEPDSQNNHAHPIPVQPEKQPLSKYVSSFEPLIEILIEAV